MFSRYQYQRCSLYRYQFPHAQTKSLPNIQLLICNTNKFSSCAAPFFIRWLDSVEGGALSWHQRPSAPVAAPSDAACFHLRYRGDFCPRYLSIDFADLGDEPPLSPLPFDELRRDTPLLERPLRL